MRNQYGGNCYKCGLWVAPDTGYFEKRTDGPGFRVQHCYRTTGGGITCEIAKAAQKPTPTIPPAKAQQNDLAVPGTPLSLRTVP